MKDQRAVFYIKLSRVYLSFFGSGYAKKAPGTAGSIAAIPLIYLVHISGVSFNFFLFLIALMTISACFIAEFIQKIDRSHDPQWIVIDEVIGMLITWAFIYNTFNFLQIGLTLLLFRIFDIVKIWPASFFDKKITHGSGTILDDVVSAIYAGLSLLLVNYFLNT